MPFGIEADIDSAIRSFQFNHVGLVELIRGPVERDLVKRAIRVETTAKRFASGRGGGPNVRTGRLRASITWRAGQDAESVYVDVGTNVHYAPYVELGTRRARARPFLRPALEAARVP